jgi:hypothetical protein
VPWRFGLPFDKLTEPWANNVGDLECAPLGVLGGMSSNAPGHRHRMIVSALLSTGTSLWDDTGDSVTITPGDNQPAGFPPLEIAGDIEVADLGLGIPSVFVDWASFYTAAAQLPGGVGGALNRILYVRSGSAKMSSVLREAMAGAGWSWSLMRTGSGMVPAFGCYDPLRLIQPDDVVATLTRTDLAELSIDDGPQWRGTVELRRGGPYDRFEFEVGGPPIDVDDAEPYELVMESTDTGRRYRSGRISWPVKDSGLRDPAPWLGTPNQQKYDWTDLARQRFASGIGERLAKQQRIYRGVYNARFAGLLGLGSPVHVVDATCEAADGTRGINHRGRVIEASIVARGTGKCSIRVAIELERKAVDAVRVWGPYAYSGDNGWNSGTSTLTIAEDFGLIGDDHVDTLGFTRPAWTTHPAVDLEVDVYESEDTTTWTLAASGTVDAVTPATPSIELTLTSGSLYRDTLKIVVPGTWPAQPTDWPGLLFAPVTAGTGLYDGTNKGIRLK